MIKQNKKKKKVLLFRGGRKNVHCTTHLFTSFYFLTIIIVKIWDIFNSRKKKKCVLLYIYLWVMGAMGALIVYSTYNQKKKKEKDEDIFHPFC